MTTTEWTNEENDAAVAAYFSMLDDDLSGAAYNKAAENRKLQELIGRSRGAIEWKHRNISAILNGLGETWLLGYKPAFNFQTPLVDAVERWLKENPNWSNKLCKTNKANTLQETPILWVNQSPNKQNAVSNEETEQVLAISRRFNVAERDERNRNLGNAGEKLVFEYEFSRLTASGRSDLANQIKWVSKEDGDGAGYDIQSFSLSGELRLLEIKTTNGREQTPFYISRNELAVSQAKKSEWRLIRLWNFIREPKAFIIKPPIEETVNLTPTNFQASFF